MAETRLTRRGFLDRAGGAALVAALPGAALFDVHTDPYEMKNLAEDSKCGKVRAELSPQVRAYAARL
jgi:hypothetical protein